MLYRPEAFEPLTDEPWAEQRVKSAIRAIVADADDALRGPRLLWKADEWDRWHGTSPMKNLYVGAAGVVWALEELRRRGHAETRLDLADLARRTLDLFRARRTAGNGYAFVKVFERTGDKRWLDRSTFRDARPRPG